MYFCNRDSSNRLAVAAGRAWRRHVVRRSCTPVGLLISLVALACSEGSQPETKDEVAESSGSVAESFAVEPLGESTLFYFGPRIDTHLAAGEDLDEVPGLSYAVFRVPNRHIDAIEDGSRARIELAEAGSEVHIKIRASHLDTSTGEQTGLVVLERDAGDPTIKGMLIVKREGGELAASATVRLTFEYPNGALHGETFSFMSSVRVPDVAR